MGTMNFSIPDEIKEAFNAEFDGVNKSAIVAELLKRAVEDRRRTKNAASFIERIREIRAQSTRTYTEDDIRKIRDEGRP